MGSVEAEIQTKTVPLKAKLEKKLALGESAETVHELLREITLLATGIVNSSVKQGWAANTAAVVRRAEKLQAGCSDLGGRPGVSRRA